MKKNKYCLPGVTVLLVVINLLVVYAYPIELSRWVRLVSSVIFFGLFINFVSRKNKFLIAAFFLFLISNICFIYYEAFMLRRFYFIAGSLSYLFLISHIKAEVKNFNLSLFQKVIFGAVLILDGFILYFLMEMIPVHIEDPFVHFLFFLYGFIMILLKMAAVSFNNRYANKASFFFVCAVLGLVFSDISLFVAYYIGFSEFYYPARIFYLLGCATLVNFTWLDKEEGKLLLDEEQDPHITGNT